ncbi:MbeB family mobilization protein [Billgrantia ethanolica]|uniref:MbeB family mobilization protein n=1 Tax=Billgrantia ethanolica TaxID=2733486 RepID=UPI001F3E9F44|nr:MbeB family mobilization protein [Halomonas ethanolica]
MSEISRLAAGFEQRSKQQAESTEQAVRSAFERHENALLAALSESEQRTSAAIRAQSRSLQRTALTSWLAVVIPVALTLLLGSGALWWMSQSVAGKLAEIERHNTTLERLAQEGGRVQLTHCGNERRLCAKIHPDSRGQRPQTFGENGEYLILEGY